MITHADVEAYNFTEFVGSDFRPFRTAAPVGSTAPDFPVTLLETGGSANLSDYWRERDLLIEFGSLT